MNLAEALKVIDPMNALALVGVTATINGSYVKFPHKCGSEAVIKAHGEKKNLWYCPKCKTGGHLISLLMEIKDLGYEEMKKELLSKARMSRRIMDELQLRYDLKYSNYLEEQGIPQETCELMEIGVPNGKAMLAGCVAFTIREEEKRIAYFGINMKTGKTKFHRSFNPELYLYGYWWGEKTVVFTTDMFDCVRLIANGFMACCNFGMDYLSTPQIEILNTMPKIDFCTKSRIIRQQVAESISVYHRFV